MPHDPDYRISRVDAIREARWQSPHGWIHICQGRPQCTHTDYHRSECKWCYAVPPYDQRTAEQIEADLILQQRGH